MNLKLSLIGAAIIFTLGYFTATKLQRPVEKIVDKVVDRVVTQTRTIIKPGETIVEETKTEDKKESIVKTINPVPDKFNYSIGAGISNKGYYGSASRRLIGDFWVEAQGTQQGALSVGLRWEF